MLEGGAITQETFESVEAQHKQAQAALSQARAMVEAAQFRINQAQAAVDAATVARKDARIMAPFDGKVTAKLADAGAGCARNPLLTLEREGGYRVDLVVPEHISSPSNGPGGGCSHSICRRSPHCRNRGCDRTLGYTAAGRLWCRWVSRIPNPCGRACSPGCPLPLANKDPADSRNCGGPAGAVDRGVDRG